MSVDEPITRRLSISEERVQRLLSDFKYELFVVLDQRFREMASERFVSELAMIVDALRERIAKMEAEAEGSISCARARQRAWQVGWHVLVAVLGLLVAISAVIFNTH